MPVNTESSDADTIYLQAMGLFNGLQPPQGEFPLDYQKGPRPCGNYGHKEAVRLFKAAAEKGHLKSQRELALCYRNGLGCRKNTRLFLRWITLAAEAGDAEAQTALGSYYDWPPGNEDKAEYWFKKAADQGDGWACWFLAQHRFSKIKQGVGTYSAEAVDLLKRGATTPINRCPEAHLHLGRCLAVGEGVAQNKVDAYGWLAVAVAEKLSGAQEALEQLLPRMTHDELEAGETLAAEYIPKYRCRYE